MPFPDVNSDLALIKHYYICYSNVQNNKILFKCQNHKATMIAKCGGNKKFRESYFLIRAGDKVPFVRNTVVDKKQIFKLNNTIYWTEKHDKINTLIQSFTCNLHGKDTQKKVYSVLLTTYFYYYSARFILF